MSARIIALLTLGLAACGHTTGTAAGPIGSELAGRTTVTTLPDGALVYMEYHPDGTYAGRLGEAAWSGTYSVADGKLCLRTTDEFECWPYAERMELGRDYDVTGPDGVRVKVRLL